MLLYPDMSRSQYEGSESFIFAAPCTEDEWYRLYTMNECVKNAAPLAYIRVGECCIILSRPDSSDDDAVETAAWIRIKHEFTGKIFAMKYAPVPLGETFASVVNRTAGANPKQVEHIDLNEVGVMHEPK